MTLYDISRRISPATAVWPGDAPFRVEKVLEKTKGAAVNLTTLHLSPHTATHADAGYHFAQDGVFPDQLPLEKYIGPAQVISLERRSGGIIPSDLGDRLMAPVQRVLIHTWVSDLPDDEWPTDFPYPTVALIDWLADQGAVLLGMDAPSVDDFNSQDLPGHHRLRQRDMVHLELITLAGVPDGVYELIALPLKIAEACGSPVRAILRELP